MVDGLIEHKCDRSKLPASTVILKVIKPKVVRTVVNLIEEYYFEVLKMKSSDDSIRQVYLPCDDDVQEHLYDEVVPNTHITLLCYRVFCSTVIRLISVIGKPTCVALLVCVTSSKMPIIKAVRKPVSFWSKQPVL